MKYYKLMTDTTLFPKGGIFTFEAKHMIMSEMSFIEQRSVLWEPVTIMEVQTYPEAIITKHDLLNPRGMDTETLADILNKWEIFDCNEMHIRIKGTNLSH